MTVTAAINQNNLGPKVTTRTTSWLELCIRAWGEEWNAPDHNVYQFGNGRMWNSSDRGFTGIYGVKVFPPLESETYYPDVDATIQTSHSMDNIFTDK